MLGLSLYRGRVRVLLWSRMPAFWYTLFSGINLANVAQAGSVALASWAIINGIDAWKREFIGKRRIELAEETLAKFFEVKDAIIMIRSPFGRIGEGSSRAPAPGETEAETEVLNRGYVVVERYQKAEKTFSDFQVLKYKFMAAFGHKTAYQSAKRLSLNLRTPQGWPECGRWRVSLVL